MQLTLSRTAAPDIAPIGLMDLPVVPGDPVALVGTEQASPVDIVEEWGIQSFPASDPPANW